MSSSPGSAATSTKGSRKAGPPETAAPALVQQLLNERRDLLVANERLRLEAEDLRRRAGRHDPRVGKLESEVARLRGLLEEARAERDKLLAGVEAAVAALRAQK